MKIPLEIKDWDKFYWQATAQGAKITSRYVGVSPNVNGGKIFWQTKYNGSTGAKWLGRFPFTQIGERTAAFVYEEYLKTVTEKSNHKGRVIPTKKQLNRKP